MPCESLAAVVMVAVYCVLAARSIEGTSITVLPLTITGPVTAAPPAEGAKVKLSVLIEELIIASEKVADTEEFGATPVSAFDGDVSETVGGVVSEAVGEGGEVTLVVINTGEDSAPPPPAPQPDRLKLATSRAAEKIPAEILALTFLPFDIRWASRNNSRRP